MENIIISVKNLCKSYKIYDNPVDRLKESVHPFKKIYHREFFALKDVCFDIYKGDTIGIIGKNGSGKSTLLKIITGVLTATSGEVSVKGKIAALLELGAGFNPEMTGIENIYLTGTLMGYTKMEMNDKLQSILDFADIGDFIHQPVKTYSSGMFARLAFSVNVNVDPSILIVDEALAVGDMFFQQKCLHRMKKMQENGTTIFFVSHAIATVKSLCDKAIYLKNGRMVAMGETEEICNLYQNDMTVSNVCALNKENSKKRQKDDLSFPVESFFRYDVDLLKKITERSGSGEVLLTAFDIYNENNEIVNRLDVGDKILIRASFEVQSDIPEHSCVGILCRDKLGIDIFACNSNRYDVYLQKMKAGERFVFEIGIDVPLVANQYFFHIGIKPDEDGLYFYDRCFTAGCLELSADPSDKAGGIVKVVPERINIIKI